MTRILLLFALSWSFFTYAQELPQLSPRSTVKQRIGLTDFTIDYSRPSVRGRNIFGDFLPYGELWRTGANERSTFETQHDIKIGGENLPAGKYGLLTIPNEKEWVIIFSKNPEGWGEGDYKEEEDALRITAQVTIKNERTESLSIGFDTFETNTASFVIAFDDTEVRIPVEVEVEKLAWEGIEQALKENPDDARTLRNAAAYALKTNQRMEDALGWIDASIKSQESWYSLWVKAQILKASDNKKEAVKTAESAIALGKKQNEDFKYEKIILSEIEKWN